MEEKRIIAQKISKKSKDLKYLEQIRSSNLVHKVIKLSLKKKRMVLDRKYSKISKAVKQPEVREKYLIPYNSIKI